ncbi:hypothetical protein [Burkholderia stagnalis]|uniref:hypothetical protein n=1 Tax=Burkholderia stagnalis TaxID=1503054 RepID=UPI001627F220
MPSRQSRHGLLSGIHASLMSKVHRARGAANADTLRRAESLGEHEAIMQALADPSHAALPQVLRNHSENTAREVLAILMQALADPSHAALPQVLRNRSENTAREVLAILERARRGRCRLAAARRGVTAARLAQMQRYAAGNASRAISAKYRAPIDRISSLKS